jgi:hypothetical protein
MDPCTAHVRFRGGKADMARPFITFSNCEHFVPHGSFVLRVVFFGQLAVFIEAITYRLNQGKLPLFFSPAVSCQQRPIGLPPPLGFYLQKISINRPYAAIPSHNLALS